MLIILPGHQVELACSYGVLEGPPVRQPAAVAPPRADLNSYTETNLWCFKSYSLTGAHCANHNIAHVKHDGTTMVPHYSRSLLCVCARACPSLPLERPVTPRASGMSDSLVDHSPRPRVALITPYGLGSVTTLPPRACWIALSPILVYKHHTSNALPSTHWGSTPRGHSTRSASTCSRAATRHFVPAQIRHVQRVLLHIE